MDGELWRWWSALERVAASPGRVTVWRGGLDWPVVGPGHLHPNPTAVVCLDGVVRIERPAGGVDLQRGDVLLLAAGVWHRHAPLRRGSVWFGQGFLPAWSDVVMADPARRWFGSVALQPTLGLVHDALAGDGPADDLAAAWLRQLVQERFATLDHRQPVLQPMVELMWRRFHVGVTAAELVKASGAGRSAAYEAFTRWYGVPPRQAILTCRLTMAEALLRQGLPVAEVAWRCGFANPDTFTRCWRKAHGSAPRSWRRAVAAPVRGGSSAPAAPG